MNIVIEGCDGTGKSTLANYLCERLNLYYWHESAPRTLEEYKQMLTPGGIVFDRFCFGQFIYNSPEERKLTQQELKELIEFFKQTQTLLIYVDCPTEVIIQRLIDRGEGDPHMKFDMEKWVKNIRGSYTQLFRESGADYITIKGDTGLCL